ncbi:DMT family transporter [Paeniglutamicibacter gangotriensis]|jgi:small multidrug resistance pump|uniref:DMT family transporter n=1 Tax=Micrococcaceae TaxID=1268 RepID=UPI002E79133C|nr:SMR family transporter [Zafaria sp. J156]MEE1622804.1 SMR family transporter [Zafaria sp. J156]
MHKWTLLAGAISSEIIATMSLRAMVSQPSWLVLVVLGYAGAFFLLGLSLRAGMPLAPAYGIWGAIAVACIALLGAIIFGEYLSTTSIIGIGVIIVGVILIETGGAKDPTPYPAEIDAGS